MREENETGHVASDARSDRGSEAGSEDQIASRRAMLRIAALSGAVVFTIRPGVAQAAVSAIKCSIPVPQSSQAGKWIKSDGSVVKAGSKNAYAPPDAPLAGEDVKNSLNYGTLYSGYGQDETSAFNNYIKTLSSGKEGYTCYASIQSRIS